MTRQSNEEFAEQLRQRLSASTDELTVDVLSRLQQARANAVHAATTQHAKASEVLTLSFPNWLAPASTATAFASLAFVAITLWVQVDNFTPSSSATFIEDIAVLSSPDDLELYENLDFYIWLEHQDSAG